MRYSTPSIIVHALYFRFRRWVGEKQLRLSIIMQLPELPLPPAGGRKVAKMKA
jgi:hypothetical protein